jgi:hypothetical protein
VIDLPPTIGGGCSIDLDGPAYEVVLPATPTDVPEHLSGSESATEPSPQCAACKGFEPHNAGQCERPAPYDVSGVKLCSYHNAVRGYVPVLYLADGTGMNHAGVVGAPPDRVDPGAGAVDALVELAERMVHTAPAGPAYARVPDDSHDTDDDHPEPGSIAEAFEREIAALVTDIGNAFDSEPAAFGWSSIPPSEAEPEPRPCTPPPREPVPVPPFMSTDSAVRKLMPVASGVLKYFPDSQMLKAWISRVGNDKHNPGEPMHWAKGKSADEPDAEVRHMLDGFRGAPADPGLEALAHLGHLASKAWRADADLQRACDEARAAFERGEDWRK